MRLHWSAASPYVRKVMACAIARGIEDRIERVETNPHASPPALLEDNPLSKVPALVTDDGLALFDSPVICEYLDSIGDAPPLFPPPGRARWVALRLQAIGDGILDAAVGRRMQQQWPMDEGRAHFHARQRAAIGRALDVLEREAASLEGPWTIGSLAVGCALGYLDFRFSHIDWRGDYPNLGKLYDKLSQRQSFIDTAPPAA